jgi:hypothetical protein
MHYGDDLNPGNGRDFKTLAEGRGVPVVMPEREDPPTFTR